MTDATGAVAAPHDIVGWYDFRDFYRRVVADAPPGSLLVEVGVFLGKSLADLAFLARSAGKGLRVVGVDHFRGSPEFGGGRVEWDGRPWEESPRFCLASECLRQLEAAGVLDDVTLVAADSVRASRLFADRSAWMVFLDAGHDEADVAADVAAWLPKVAPGGILAGDDYAPDAFPGVVAAVDARFPRVRVNGRTWEVRC